MFSSQHTYKHTYPYILNFKMKWRDSTSRSNFFKLKLRFVYSYKHADETFYRMILLLLNCPKIELRLNKKYSQYIQHFIYNNKSGIHGWMSPSMLQHGLEVASCWSYIRNQVWHFLNYSNQSHILLRIKIKYAI